jgi:DNA-binding GntR family transcriptional regulator
VFPSLASGNVSAEDRVRHEEAKMAKPPADAQALTDTDTLIFEAIATLEFTGRRPRRSAIAAGVRLDCAVVDQALSELAESGLVRRTEEDGEAVYEPTRRDWSTQPGQAAGHPMA